MKTVLMNPEFVSTIPDNIKEKVLYISIDYKVCIHLCACGCKKEVVTPIDPKGWSIFYDGNAITLNPSIGNWSLPCKSHYWIRNNYCIEAGPLVQSTRISEKKKKWSFIDLFRK